MKQQRTGGGSFAPRTDRACEAGRPGAESRSRTVTVGSAPVTVTRSRERDGGRFVTVSCGSLTGREEDIEALACLLAGEITELATLMLGRAPDPSLRVLVAGLGNDQITPDAVGPGTAARLSVTRHLKACRAGLYEPMVWQCVYRRAFLTENGLAMAEGLLFEDELFQAPALLRAQRAAAFEMDILCYRQRAGSIMGSFARSSCWCASYLEVCRRLSALADTLPAGEAKAALQKRVGQIALSVVKNIPAYHLPEAVAGEAMAFAGAHREELSGYALRSGDALVAAQGLLLRMSPGVFIKLYTRV